MFRETYENIGMFYQKAIKTKKEAKRDETKSVSQLGQCFLPSWTAFSMLTVQLGSLGAGNAGLACS